jgi:UDP-glucose 4-epimerase
VTNAPRRAAIVGAGGFIGSALARGLVKANIPVAGFTRDIPFINHDQRLHEDLLAADTVYWLASSIRPATASRQQADTAADREALTRLLDGLGQHGSFGTRIVVVSSGGTVYDPACPSPHSETSPLVPANEYGEAMLAIESLARDRAPRAVVLRVSNAYGPGQKARRGQGVIAHWMSGVARNEPIHVLGSDEVARDYVYIDDIVDALLRVHVELEVPTVTNIGSGTATTLRELVTLLRETVAPTRLDIRYDPSRAFDAPSAWLDVSLAARELGWTPRVDLVTGLARTWQHVCHAMMATG